MRKLLIGLALALSSSASFAQSVLQFDVVFDRVLEASGSFTPNLTPIVAGPFCSPPSCTIPPVTLTGHVILSAVPSSTQLTAINSISLNGSFSTQSGFAPAANWSVHTFNNAVFNLYDQDPPASFFGINIFNPGGNDWGITTSTAQNGVLSDFGPTSIYGGSCPQFFPAFGCNSAQSGGSPNGTTAADFFDTGTPIFASGSPVFNPSFRNSGNHPLISGSVTQTNPSTGLGFENGMDAFALQGVMDTVNTQGNGTSQLYPTGVNGYPGVVRIVTFSSTGNTAYVVEGHIVYGLSAVPVPGAVWLAASGLGLLGALRRRKAA